MQGLVKRLSDDEILNFTENAKGVGDPAWCTYYLALCASGYDSGTCSWIFSQCGYGGGGGGGGGCGTCTCQ
ncbi:glycocin F family RiPP peptide [Ornithinibacillus sp. 179-J 7C1 HS]|uniref:glycocin F family RiPP peptide n=1 Tax=Ornithinibacillus sp. 179-J 7C1 HS TaxID=3142384 RepID=UPI0039A23843